MIKKISDFKFYNKYKRFKKKHFTLSMFFLSFLLVFLINFGISSIFGVNIIKIGTTKFLTAIGVYTEEIRSVTINSDNYSDPASWHINKSAGWTGMGKAQVKFNLDTVVDSEKTKRDVILVLDVSGSMTGPRLSMMKQDTKELINYILSEENSRVALITFDTTSAIMSEFTSDKNRLVGIVDGIEERNCTNYYAALVNVEKVLAGYEKQNNCELVTLFLTDGYPNIDTPNQVGQYQILKEKYPYMTINGVQYEMGQKIVKELEEITDNQFAADINNLGNILFSASVDPKYYEKFVITDYIEDEFWTVEDVNSIKVNKGSVKLEEENGVQKVIWNLKNDYFMTGESATMTIDIKLKDKYLGGEGFYPTNEKEEINTKEEGSASENVTSTKTPVLRADYLVTYDSNLPAKCGKSIQDTEKHFAFENVNKRSTVLECEDYQFKGWEIVDDGVKKINNDVFVMPTKDVLIRGVWSKVSVDKAVIGTVKEKASLYEIVMNDADSNKYARRYTGTTSTFNGEEKVYYYYDAAALNNVIFGNYCWKIVRTTDTGGVKMMYNGVPSEDGKCLNTGAASQLTAEQMGISSNTTRFSGGSILSTSPSGVGYMYDSSYAVTSRSMAESVITMVTEVVGEDVYTNVINDVTIPFEFDSTTNKWTSMNHDDSSKSTLEFSVNAEGLYFLEYVVSSESSYDFATIYVDGVQKGKFSGTQSGKLRLEDLTTDSVIKVEYSKDSSSSKGSDNIVFNLAKQSDGEVIDNRWLFGNTFKYEDGVYTLDPESSKKVDFSNEASELSNYHYTCFNAEGVCDKLGYIYRADEKIAYIIYIKGDEDIETALDNMIYTKANKENSAIKGVIDTWYTKYMLPFNDYLEDTVWCNKRSIGRIGGWNPNGGNVTTTNGDLYFASNSAGTNLDCPNLADRFTTKVENGNGALTYPVGLITKQEVGLSGPALWSGNEYWTMTPFYFVQANPCTFVADNSASYGVRFWCSMGDSQGVRPTISLRAGIKSDDGDGSADNPYIISTES